MANRLLPVRFLGYLSSVTFAASVAFWLLVVYRFVSYDENHVGWNILLAIPVFVAGSIASALAARSTRRARYLVFGVAGILSVVLAFVCYRFNILVPYEV